ncbi:hypothetical protein AB0H49_33970 [Nocardia sp. NPDC050713]|uniref:hypothetical protein n=1 Tax=Nocardia sp. NPDC050713 TaxID=3154511 RepID=UPI0033FC888D
MTSQERPQPRKRTPRPAPDANQDPMDLPDRPSTTAKPASQKSTTPRKIVRSVTVRPKALEESNRAEVQLGVRVSPKVQEHLEKVKAATGWTRRELVEQAILALKVPGQDDADNDG